MRTLLRAALCGAVFVAPAVARAQTPLWADLRPGPHAVGYRAIDTVDVTRSFPSMSGTMEARPMRMFVWYPARRGTGRPLVLRELVLDAPRRGDTYGFADTLAYARFVGRIRAGAAPGAPDGDAAADALLGTILEARRAAAPVAGRFPVILLSPGAPDHFPTTAEYLASHGFVVIGTDQKDLRTIRSMAFTPNPGSIAADTDDLGFALGVARGLANADAGRVGVLAYSSSGMSTLSFAFRSRAVRAVAVFDGWEGRVAGQDIVRAIPGYDSIGFRAAYLAVEVSETIPGAGWAPAAGFFDAMAAAPRWQLVVHGSSHGDFASYRVADPHAPRELRDILTLGNRAVGDFFRAQLTAGTPGPAAGTAWSDSLARIPGVVVTYRAPTLDVPAADEFFRLAESNVLRADSVARRLAQREPPVVPFTESGLSRLALLTSSRRPADAAILYGIVARGFPASPRARVNLAEALKTAGRLDEALGAAREANRLIASDSTLSEAAAGTLRTRVERVLAGGRP